MERLATFWTTRTEAEKASHVAIGSGVRDVQRLIAACGFTPVVESERDLERCASSPDLWMSFLQKIETHSDPSRRVNGTDRSLVLARIEAHDAIMPTFMAMIDAAEKELKKNQNQNQSTLTMTVLPVPRLRADTELSYERFIEEFAVPGKPVVITHLNMTSTPWTLEHLKRVCGHVRVTLNTKSVNTTNWGGLIAAGTMKLGAFIDGFNTNDTMRSWYLHDWTLPRQCPEIFGPPPFDAFIVPKYFSGDYFQRIPWIGYENSWPSLFIGANGTESLLHIDSGETNFWMYLLSGVKRWRFWDREQAFNLYKKPTSAHFRFRAFGIDLERNPLVSDAPMYEVVQYPGELVFVPSGAPHAVMNEDDIVALSMNYVDGSNLWRYLGEKVKLEEWEDIERFDVFKNPMGMSKSMGDVTFGEWKSGREKAEARYKAYEARRSASPLLPAVPLWVD